MNQRMALAASRAKRPAKRVDPAELARQEHFNDLVNLASLSEISQDDALLNYYNRMGNLRGDIKHLRERINAMLAEGRLLTEKTAWLERLRASRAPNPINLIGNSPKLLPGSVEAPTSDKGE